MSYSFQIEGDPSASFHMNSSEMSMMREFMREVGAVAASQVRSFEEPATAKGAAAMAKFQSNGGQLVTADECAIIASRLAENRAIISELASFFDDSPAPAALRSWVQAWVDFNQAAAKRGGYRVS